MTRRIYYKSDFDFILRINDHDGIDIGFPEFDFTVRLWTGQKSNAMTVSKRGGTLTNCFNDGGQIHVVAKNHCLGPGLLQAELTAQLNDEIYSDGIRRDVSVADLDIELTRDKDAGGLTIEAKNNRPWRRKWMAAREVPITVHTPKFHDPHNSRWYALQLTKKEGHFFATMKTGYENKLTKPGWSGLITVPGIDDVAKIVSVAVMKTDGHKQRLHISKSKDLEDTYEISNGNLTFEVNDVTIFRFQCDPYTHPTLYIRPEMLVKIGFINGRLHLQGLGNTAAGKLKLHRPILRQEAWTNTKVGKTIREMFVEVFNMSLAEERCVQIRQSRRCDSPVKDPSSRGWKKRWAGCGWRIIRQDKSLIGVFRLRYKKNTLNASDWTYVTVLKRKGEKTIRIKEIK